MNIAQPKNEADVQRALEGIHKVCEQSDIDSSFYEEAILRILNGELPNFSFKLNWKPSIYFREAIPLTDETVLDIVIGSKQDYHANF